MAENTEKLTAVLRRDHGEIRCVVELPRFAFAPVQAGQTVGLLRFIEVARDGSSRELGTVGLTAAYAVKEITYPRSLWERILSLFAKKN
jgi:hypothetical protein